VSIAKSKQQTQKEQTSTRKTRLENGTNIVLERKLKDTQITPRKNTSLNQSALEALVTSNERCQRKNTLSQSQSTTKLKEQ